MTPKGSSFLFVKKEFQGILDPLIISWGYDSISPSESTFFDYHQFNGTRDFSAYLTLPKAIEFREKYAWEDVSTSCKLALLECAPKLFNELKTQPLAPLNSTYFGQICSSEIQTEKPEQLQRLLYEKYKIEIPIMRHGLKNYIRFSFQAFNTEAEIDFLIYALQDIKKQSNLLF